MPIRYTTDDDRSAEQVAVDDRIREEVERTGGVWAQMTAEQRAQVLARLREKQLSDALVVVLAWPSKFDRLATPSRTRARPDRADRGPT